MATAAAACPITVVSPFKSRASLLQRRGRLMYGGTRLRTIQMHAELPRSRTRATRATGTGDPCQWGSYEPARAATGSSALRHPHFPHIISPGLTVNRDERWSNTKCQKLK